MSIVLDFSICQQNNCKSFSFEETTGALTSQNVNGWGSSNDLTSAATAATLQVLTPDSNIFTFNLFAQTPNWPTTSDTNFYIYSSDLGMGSSSILLDGQYKFTYTVTTPTATYTKIVYKLFYCNLYLF